MRTIEDTIQSYIDTWNETDPARRRAAIRSLYTEDCTYTDPHADLSGPEAIDAFVGQVQERFPGVRFELAGAVDAHHTQVRFTWRAMNGGAGPLAVGTDVALVADGRIRRVYGFQDQAPAAT